jgi:hypothetical protein
VCTNDQGPRVPKQAKSTQKTDQNQAKGDDAFLRPRLRPHNLPARTSQPAQKASSSKPPQPTIALTRCGLWPNAPLDRPQPPWTRQQHKPPTSRPPPSLSIMPLTKRLASLSDIQPPNLTHFFPSPLHRNRKQQKPTNQPRPNLEQRP